MSPEKFVQSLPGEKICRDCGQSGLSQTHLACANCSSQRLVWHPEINELSIAHLDCDAFYAAVEKRDNPDLADRPVIIGGGRRGVVSTACYIARLYGVHSAMPMFKALKACPDAVVIRPNMEKYVAVGRQVRRKLQSLSPLVEPISIDEAFVDLSGTTTLTGKSPALQLVRAAIDIEDELGITVSIGLSFNKFLAKVASDLDKPRGFTVVGRGEAEDFLANKPVTIIWGVGKALNKKLKADNIRSIADLRRLNEADLTERYGSMGSRLWHLARGLDNRLVRPHRGAKSVSSETTFREDLHRLDDLRRKLWQLSERVSVRLKKSDLAAGGVVLKLKTANFQTLTRSHTLETPTQLAERLFKAALPMLEATVDRGPFRLIGIGAQPLADADKADPPSLLNPEAGRTKAVEDVMDEIRGKLGNDAIIKGRGFEKSETDGPPAGMTRDR